MMKENGVVDQSTSGTLARLARRQRVAYKVRIPLEQPPSNK